LSGEAVRRLPEVLAIDRHLLTIRSLLTVAMVQDDFRCPFDQQELFAVGCFVQRRHELVLGLERMASIRG
jgi:hypothetical protein